MIPNVLEIIRGGVFFAQCSKNECGNNSADCTTNMCGRNSSQCYINKCIVNLDVALCTVDINNPIKPCKILESGCPSDSIVSP